MRLKLTYSTCSYKKTSNIRVFSQLDEITSKLAEITYTQFYSYKSIKNIFSSVQDHRFVSWSLRNWPYYYYISMKKKKKNVARRSSFWFLSACARLLSIQITEPKHGYSAISRHYIVSYRIWYSGAWCNFLHEMFVNKSTIFGFRCRVFFCMWQSQRALKNRAHAIHALMPAYSFGK